MNHTVNYEVRDPKMEEIQREIGRKLKAALPSGWGFMLMLFEFGKQGANFYISNADRADCIRVMEEWIARARGEVTSPLPGQLEGHYEKLCAVLINKLADAREGVVVTSADLESFAAISKLPTITLSNEPDNAGLRLRVLTFEEAQAAAQAEREKEKR
jgi:hypothetical protein